MTYEEELRQAIRAGNVRKVREMRAARPLSEGVVTAIADQPLDIPKAEDAVAEPDHPEHTE